MVSDFVLGRMSCRMSMMGYEDFLSVIVALDLYY